MQNEFTAYTLANLANLAKQREPADVAAERPELPAAHKAELLAALTAETVQAARSAPPLVLATPSPAVLSPAEAANLVEHYTERAAIAEYDGELPRQEAEAQARQAVFQGRYPYYFTLAESPGQTPVVITAAATVEAARAEIEQRFGPCRVIACWAVGEVRP